MIQNFYTVIIYIINKIKNFFEGLIPELCFQL